jgi:hypothetical protein
MDEPKFLGESVGVRIDPRGDGKKDRHLMVTIMAEDDGNWHDKDSMSSFWLDETIEVLQEARRWLKKNAKKTKWGYDAVQKQTTKKK